jgi:hypothetical protein
MNQTVSGGPIRFGTRTFVAGIGVHSRSKLVFAVPDAYPVFRTQYAIAGDLPYADVTVRVFLDDRLVHEQVNTRAGKLSPALVVDLEGAKRVTLEVDFGENFDVQDRLNWIEPAFLRERPKPPVSPQTQPPATTAAPSTAPASVSGDGLSVEPGAVPTTQPATRAGE